MNFFSYIRESIGTLLQNKMRSTLSLLGIIIGISSVVVVTSIGDGMKAEILKNIGSTQNVIRVVEGEFFRGDKGPGMQGSESYPAGNEAPIEDLGPDLEQEIASKRVFTVETAEKLEEVFKDYVKAVIPVIPFRSSMPMKIEGWVGERYAQVRLINNNFFAARGMKVARGMMFSDFQIENKEPVAIIGSNVVRETFDNKEPVGKNIFINNTPFRIVGILEKTNDYEADGTIYVSIATADARFGKQNVKSLEIYAKDIKQMHELQRNVGYFLMKYTNANNPQGLNFHLETNESYIKYAMKQIDTVSIFVSGIAAISWLVGGIGIMNIMLVSVTERTREIGIRKAIGARKKDIILQFLVESSILSFIGGICAVALSYLISFGMEYFFSHIKTLITMNTILIATGFSILVGIIFGLLPAWKAAKMNVIDALRFE